MPGENMKYVFTEGEGDDETLRSASVEGDDRDFFLEAILPTLRPLSDEEYMHGPVLFLSTWAKYSYILFKQDVYWCVEWDPGLIVIRLSPNGTMAWNAFRSPIPDFGGREPMEQDVRDYDEDLEDYQDHLVYRAWAAQFDKGMPGELIFERASETDAEAYRAALKHVQTLGDQMEALYSGDDQLDKPREECTRNLTLWAGEGVRVSR